MVKVAERTDSGCHEQWHRTRLPSQGSTSTVSVMERNLNGGRGQKLPVIVCAWPPVRPRRGSKLVSQSGRLRTVPPIVAFSEISGVTVTRQTKRSGGCRWSPWGG